MVANLGDVVDVVDIRNIVNNAATSPNHGNIHQFHTCGGSLNTTGACDRAIDDLLNKAREVSDQAQRIALYNEAIDKLVLSRRNLLYLYHQNPIVAYPKNLKNYKAVPDGLIRLKGTSWN